MKYRREIDGLRSMAVVPVILFHAGFIVFGGGYVGVDVFFVISGYLITTILVGELEGGKFSILKFYERRARRILPALFFVLLCCIPPAWLWMRPSQFDDFAKSLVAVVAFGSNILFWRQSGYFAANADFKPLLHTWSLAVEEQYYLLFPMLLYGVWRFGRNRALSAIVAIALLSFLLSEWAWRNQPSANFYLAPTRAWELLAGSICAFMPVARVSKASNWLSAAGLALIVFAIFAYDSSTPFPSVYALAPVGGTALIILFGGPGTWAARILSTRPFVGIGLISYSAYLWHQPLFAFARIRSGMEPERWLMLLLALLSLAMGYVSWRYIEQPFRKRPAPLLPSRRGLFGASAAAGAALAGIGIFWHFQQGAPYRIAPSGQSFAAALADRRLAPNFGLHSDCEARFTLSRHCRTGDSPAMLLWGDSLAMHLAMGLKASPTHVDFIQLTKSQCAPILDIADRGSITPWRDCLAFNDTVMAWLRANKSVRYVVISSTFDIIGSKVYDRNGNSTDEEQVDLVKNKIIRTANDIRALGKIPVVISPTPQTGGDIGECLSMSIVLGRSAAECNFHANDMTASNKKVFGFLKGISNVVPIIWLDDLICTASTCLPLADGIFIYRDSKHLSREGSAYIGRKYDLTGLIISASSRHSQNQGGSPPAWPKLRPADARPTPPNPHSRKSLTSAAETCFKSYSRCPSLPSAPTLFRNCLASHEPWLESGGEI